MQNLKYIFVTLIFLLFSNVNAQIKPIETLLDTPYSNNPNTYYKDTNNRLAQCAGTWEYNNGIDYFKITFTVVKELIDESYNIYADRLKSQFIYKKSGIVKYDNYGNLYSEGSNVNTKPSTIKTGFVMPSIITFTYSEPSSTNCYRRKVGDLDIEYQAGTPAKLIWKRTTSESYFRNEPCLDGSEVDDAPFIIPADMVLTKIN